MSNGQLYSVRNAVAAFCVRVQGFGTYLHGILDNQALLESWLSWAGLKQITPFDYPAFRDQQLDYLADEVEKVWSIEQIKGLLKLDSTQ